MCEVNLIVGMYELNYHITHHAKEELQRRNIPQILLDQVLNDPQQIVSGRYGRKIFQSQLDFGADKMYLLRVIVDDRTDPAVVLTAYRTSRIDKYWSSS